MAIEKAFLLDWTQVAEWRDVVVDAALTLFAPAHDRTWLLSRKPDTIAWDTHEWYEPLCIESGIQDDQDFLRTFGRKLPDLFENLRAVHLCRPLDFNTYKTRGIVRLDPVEMQASLSAFLMSEHPDLSQSDIDRAIVCAGRGLATKQAKVFFAIDERFMLEFAGHYAVFGSEYQLDIAARLGTGNFDYRQTLQKRGRPAYVVLHLPFAVLTDDDLKDLAGDLLPAAISSLHLGVSNLCLTGSGWDISMDVPPEWVQEVVHAPHAK
ncbi:MAG: hypothetical protein ACTHLZ_16015 [Tepidisphaeraceae bacterium]